MRKIKKYAALLLAAALCVLALAGCEKEEEGIDLSVCVGGPVENLDPIYATEQADQTLLINLYENLMRTTVDVSGGTTVTNGIAKNVDQEENYDGTVTYTFKLRSAKWSDGRSVTADDFVYAWQRLVDPANQSPLASTLSVVAGYDAVQESGDVTQLQVSAKNDSTLVVVLNGKYDWFLTDVCTATATLPVRQDILEQWEAAQEEQEEQEAAESQSWWSDVAGLVTNGPYTVESYAAGSSLVLTASTRYYGTQSGPAHLTFRFARDAQEAWKLYEEKEVDFVASLPQEQLDQLAEEGTLTPELGTYTILLNCQQGVLGDVQVRQALTAVIDRTAVAQAAGGTAQAAEGLVPPGVPGDGEEDFRSAGALLDNDPSQYESQCRQARILLEQAGYDNGGVGELEYLYVDEGNNAAVARVLTGQWYQALGVQVTARAVTQKELDAALQSGSYTMAGVDLQAVGNDAECFLMTWTADRQENAARYENSAYDTLMSIIAGAADETARMGCLHDAEALLLDDAALAPLYTTGTAWQLREDLTGLCRDARGWFSFASVTTRAA